jgi:CelD/BcsL family acetyltransferase involved in cellulose biosynthesis
MTLRITTVTTLPELQLLHDEWEQLFVRTKETLPFLHPDWALTWWDHFHVARPIVHNALYVKVLRRQSGELVAIAPLMRTERPARGPLRTRSLDFLGAGAGPGMLADSSFYITEEPGALVDPDHALEAGVALARDLLDDHGWDWIGWHGLIRESAFVAGLEREMQIAWTGSQVANLVPLPPSWDAFKATLKRNIRESLRHCYNSLKRDGITFRFEVAATPSDVDAALDTFLRLHAMRAAMTGTSVHPNHFASARAQRFLRALFARLAKTGIARVFTIVIDGQPAAVRLGCMLSSCLYLYYSGYDPRWAKYGIMTTAVAESIKYAIDRGVPLVHLSMGLDVSKSRWGTDTPAYHEATSVRPALASRAAHEGRRLVLALGRLIG